MTQNNKPKITVFDDILIESDDTEMIKIIKNLAVAFKSIDQMSKTNDTDALSHEVSLLMYKNGFGVEKTSDGLFCYDVIKRWAHNNKNDKRHTAYSMEYYLERDMTNISDYYNRCQDYDYQIYSNNGPSLLIEYGRETEPGEYEVTFRIPSSHLKDGYDQRDVDDYEFNGPIGLIPRINEILSTNSIAISEINYIKNLYNELVNSNNVIHSNDKIIALIDDHKKPIKNAGTYDISIPIPKEKSYDGKDTVLETEAAISPNDIKKRKITLINDQAKIIGNMLKSTGCMRGLDLDDENYVSQVINFLNEHDIYNGLVNNGYYELYSYGSPITITRKLVTFTDSGLFEHSK